MALVLGDLSIQTVAPMREGGGVWESSGKPVSTVMKYPHSWQTWWLHFPAVTSLRRRDAVLLAVMPAMHLVLPRVSPGEDNHNKVPERNVNILWWSVDAEKRYKSYLDSRKEKSLLSCKLP